MRMMPRSLVSLGIVLAVSAAVSAAPLLVDFNDVAAAPTAGGVWNTLDAPDGTPFGDLKYADGTDATGVTISLSFDAEIGWQDSSTDQGVWPASDKEWVDSDAVSDYFWSYGWGDDKDDKWYVTIGGLPTGLPFDVELTSVRNGGSDTRYGDYLVNGAYTTNEANSDNYANIPGWNNSEILKWSDVALDGNGEIVIEIIDDDFQGEGSTVWLNSMYIEQVPEPATLAVMGLGGLAMLRRRRR